MIIQINTDHTIQPTAEKNAEIESTIQHTLKRFEDYLTRVEVHFKDENSHKPGVNDITCTLEARPKGMDPLVSHDSSGDLDGALRGAADKMKTLLSKEIEKKQGW